MSLKQSSPIELVPTTEHFNLPVLGDVEVPRVDSLLGEIDNVLKMEQPQKEASNPHECEGCPEFDFCNHPMRRTYVKT